MSETGYINRIAFCFLGLVFCSFLLVSLLGFSINDWPNPDVAPTYQFYNQADYLATQNITLNNPCGRVGAWLAYHINYYFGPGFKVLIASAVIMLVLYCLKKPVEQFLLRAIGIFLICLSVSAGKFLYCPGSDISLSCGNGGILGIATGHFLLTNTAESGAIMIVVSTFLVGLLLAADNLVLMLPRLLWLMTEQLRQAGPILVAVNTAGKKAVKANKKPRQPKADASNFEIYKQTSNSAVADLEDELEEYDEVDDFEDYQDQEPEYQELEEEEIEEIEEDDIEVDQEEDYLEDISEEQYDEDALLEDEIAATEARQQKSREFTGPTVSALARMLGQKTTRDATPGAGGELVDYHNYKYPPAELLEEPVYGYNEQLAKAVKQRAKILEQALREFKVETEVVSIETGPVITMFELKLAPGTKVSQITRLQYDIARALSAPTIRIVAPIPGKQTIGIEAPNIEKETVRIKELLQLAGDKPGKMQIPLFLGKDATGAPLITDLAAMPHCLIAGTTGSGKSVCINTIIVSILLTQRPDMVKLILVDPKMVEMNAFANISHLMCPIVTEMKRAEQILEWLTNKMDERYSLLAQAKVRNIVGYNKLTEDEIYKRVGAETAEQQARTPSKLPYLVVIIDELADLMMTSAKEVESYIVRLAQKSRAVGIHLILATQRPQATVVTGLIKSNMPARISFRVAAKMDSRIVLDTNGAETLLGQGDMLFLKPGTSDLIRCQGAYISDDEINSITTYLKEVSQPSYSPELMQLNRLGEGTGERDELFDEAVKSILQTKRGSVSLLQRQFSIGYGRASRLIDQMAEAGIVGEYKGSQAREVLMTLQEYESIKRQMKIDAINGYTDLQTDPNDLQNKVEHVIDPTQPTIILDEDELQEEEEMVTTLPAGTTSDGRPVRNAVIFKTNQTDDIDDEEIEDELDDQLTEDSYEDEEYEDDDDFEEEEQELEEDDEDEYIEEEEELDEEEEFIDAVTYLEEEEDEEEDR